MAVSHFTSAQPVEGYTCQHSEIRKHQAVEWKISSLATCAHVCQERGRIFRKGSDLERVEEKERSEMVAVQADHDKHTGANGVPANGVSSAWRQKSTRLSHSNSVVIR